MPPTRKRKPTGVGSETSRPPWPVDEGLQSRPSESPAAGCRKTAAKQSTMDIQNYVCKHEALTVIKVGEMTHNYLQARKLMASEKAMTLRSSGSYPIHFYYCGQKGHSVRD